LCPITMVGQRSRTSKVVIVGENKRSKFPGGGKQAVAGLPNRRIPVDFRDSSRSEVHSGDAPAASLFFYQTRARPKHSTPRGSGVHNRGLSTHPRGGGPCAFNHPGKHVLWRSKPLGYDEFFQSPIDFQNNSAYDGNGSFFCPCIRITKSHRTSALLGRHAIPGDGISGCST